MQEHFPVDFVLLGVRNLPAMEAHLSDEFIDRLRRAYQFALDVGARTRDRMPNCQFDTALNVDSMTEMSFTAALHYLTWINQHARLFISMKHEVNAFTVASIAKSRLAAKRFLERRPVPERDGYFEEISLVDPELRGRNHRISSG